MTDKPDKAAKLPGKKKVERQAAVKTKIYIPRAAKIALKKLTTTLLDNGVGDGTEHNTMLYCMMLANDLDFNPFQEAPEGMTMAMVHMPPNIHLMLHTMAKMEGKKTIQQFLEESLEKGLKKITNYNGEPILRLRKVRTKTHIEAGTTIVVDTVMLKNAEGEEQEYTLHAPSEWKELGYNGYSQADYHMRFGNATHAVVARKSLIAQQVKEGPQAE